MAKVSQTVGLLALEKILTCPGEGRWWPGQVAKSKSSASKASEEGMERRWWETPSGNMALWSYAYTCRCMQPAASEPMACRFRLWEALGTASSQRPPAPWPRLPACPGERVSVHRRFSPGQARRAHPRESPPPSFGWAFSPSAAGRARLVVPRGRWVYGRGSFQGRPGRKNWCDSPRVSRRPILAGLSRRPTSGAHEPWCREVGGYIREGLSEIRPTKSFRRAHPA